MEDKKNETMKKNKKNLRWAMPMIAALCLTMATACSSDENAVETPQTKTITFGVKVDEASAPATRNAAWDYEDEYTGNTLKLNWDATNNIKLYRYVEKAYENNRHWVNPVSGTMTVDDKNLKTVAAVFDGTPSWTDSDGLMAFFPDSKIYTVAEGTDGMTKSIFLPSAETQLTSFTQTGKNTTHLADYMYMYGTLPCGSTSGKDVNAVMTLHHIPAVLRSLVINMGAAPRIIKQVEIVASEGFTSQVYVTYMKQEVGDDFDMTMNSLSTAESITVICSDGTEKTEWNKLAATGATATADRLMAYALCFPTATAQDYTFKVTATDADGSNETTYTSNVIKSDRLQALKSGYYYTFELLLDDKLTASLANVSALPGWGTDTEL